jgi:hypothetical protein
MKLIIKPFCIGCLFLIQFSCSQKNIDSSNTNDDLISWASKDGEAVLLPDAGSSWYSITIPDCKLNCDTACKHGHTFRSKNVSINGGPITVKFPDYTSVDSIALLTTDRLKNAKWSVYWSVLNQRGFSVNMVDPRIEIQVDSSLSITLFKLDGLSANQLMYAQEDAIKGITNMLSKTKFTTLIREWQGLDFKNYNVQNVVSWLPEICLNDGPSLHKKPQDTAGVFLCAYNYGNEAIVNWVRQVFINDDSTATSLHSRKYNIVTDSTINEVSEPVKKGIRIFSLINWSTRGEFSDWWKRNHPKKPLPNVMPPDAGLAIQTSIIGGAFNSDNLVGFYPNYSTIVRAEQLVFVGPPGQLVAAILTEGVQ